METIQGQGRDAEQKPLNAGFGPTTTAAEVISGPGKGARDFVCG